MSQYACCKSLQIVICNVEHIKRNAVKLNLFTTILKKLCFAMITRSNVGQLCYSNKHHDGTNIYSNWDNVLSALISSVNFSTTTVKKSCAYCKSLQVVMLNSYACHEKR